MPLTPERCKAICDERLASWVAKLIASNATPIALVGVSHDGKANLVICTIEGDERFNDLKIADLIIGAGYRLKREAS